MKTEYSTATARQILMLKKEAYNQIHDLTEYQKNTIRIGFTPGRGIDMFSQVYPHFHERFPQTRIEPNELSVREQQDLLLSGDLDLGFMTLMPEQERPGLSYQSIAEEELLLAIPSRLANILSLPDFSSDSLPVCNLAILKEEPFVLIHKKSTARDLIDSLFQTAGFAPQILFETASNQTILSMIRSEICCGILPAYYVDLSLREVTYYRLPSHPFWNITAACRKSRSFNLPLEFNTCQRMCTAKIIWANTHQNRRIGIFFISGMAAHAVGYNSSFFGGSIYHSTARAHAESINRPARRQMAA